MPSNEFYDAMMAALEGRSFNPFLTAAAAPPAGGKVPGKIILTNEERAIAKALGVTDFDFAKAKYAVTQETPHAE